MIKDLIKFGDLGFGKCPHCSETTTFFPTETQSVLNVRFVKRKLNNIKMEKFTGLK
jgi:hypothetical protein